MCRNILHLSERGSSVFIKMRETPPVCREHVHTGRPHKIIDNSIFKKSNVMSFQ